MKIDPQDIPRVCVARVLRSHQVVHIESNDVFLHTLLKKEPRTPECYAAVNLVIAEIITGMCVLCASTSPSTRELVWQENLTSR